MSQSAKSTISKNAATIAPSNHHYRYQNEGARPAVVALEPCDNVGHGDHWALFGVGGDTVQAWLKQSLATATVARGLAANEDKNGYLITASNDVCHIKQVFALKDFKPTELKTLFPAINSPYGLPCTISQITVCKDTTDAVLKLKTADGTDIYAFDTLYAINAAAYRLHRSYYVNFAAFAYTFAKSAGESLTITDIDALKYHYAYNAIVAQNGGKVPADLRAQIAAYKFADDHVFEPITINTGNSCIYLFGETVGQEDEAWCQGQVLGKSETTFFEQTLHLFDVAILREGIDGETVPMVVRIATPKTNQSEAVAVQDYITANIWLQAAIYGATQQDGQTAE